MLRARDSALPHEKYLMKVSDWGVLWIIYQKNSLKSIWSFIRASVKTA
jgi:hypothetical protein